MAVQQVNKIEDRPRDNSEIRKEEQERKKI